MFGASDDDGLTGGACNDRLVGGNGSDLMTGGAGADRFDFRVTMDPDGTDSILDFEVGTDKLGIGNLSGGPGSIPTITFAEQGNGTTLVTIGDPTSPIFEISVTEVSGIISQTDIVFSFMG